MELKREKCEGLKRTVFFRVVVVEYCSLCVNILISFIAAVFLLRAGADHPRILHVIKS